MKAIWFITLLLLGAAGFAADGGSIRIDDPWAAETPPTANTGVVYLKVVNAGAADRLLGAKTAAATYVELHASILDGDVMRMRKVEAVDLAGEATTVLEPGGLHIMLLELKQPLQDGQSFALTLEFERAGRTEIQVPVRKREEMIMNAMPEPMRGHGHGKQEEPAKP